LLLIGVLLLVGLFRSSERPGVRYGIAVTERWWPRHWLAFVVIWKVWKWSWLATAALIVAISFYRSDLSLGNLLKV